MIVFSQKKPTPEGSGDFYATDFEGTITVNKEDYSVFNITGKVKAPKNNRQDRSLAVADSNTDFLKNVNYEFSVDYHNLLVDRITLSKTYIYQNEHVADNMVLKVERAHANNLTVLNNRNYFPGD